MHMLTAAEEACTRRHWVLRRWCRQGTPHRRRRYNVSLPMGYPGGCPRGLQSPQLSFTSRPSNHFAFVLRYDVTTAHSHPTSTHHPLDCRSSPIRLFIFCRYLERLFGVSYLVSWWAFA